MDKKIEMSREEMCNYFIREQKAVEYGKEFFKELCRIDIKTLENQILPISCYDEMDEFVYSMETGDKTAIYGGFCCAGEKQAYIRIGIDAQNSILNKKLKQIIRHEIIHYYLWLVDLPWNDDDLIFWCLCHVYDAGAYEELEYEDEEYYNLFVSLFDSYVVDLQPNIRNLVIGQIITGINTTPIDKYKDFVINMVNQAKKIFSLRRS